VPFVPRSLSSTDIHARTYYTPIEFLESLLTKDHAMRATLTIAKDLRLPADAVTQTFAILAKRGAGKT
jgi:hypothetical protein